MVITLTRQNENLRQNETWNEEYFKEQEWSALRKAGTNPFDFWNPKVNEIKLIYGLVPSWAGLVGGGSWGSPQSSDSGNGYFTSKDVDHWMKMLNKIWRHRKSNPLRLIFSSRELSSERCREQGPGRDGHGWTDLFCKKPPKSACL